ncbi:unnamed protein product [Alternaria sp. RS040]
MARPLTDAERARVRAHMDFLDRAMAVIRESEFDPDKVNAAHMAAARAYPVSKGMFQAYSAEVLIEAQPGLVARYELVLMNDQSKFEGAGPEKIREHFHSWAVDELQRNWRADREPATKDEITDAAGSPDYLHCAGSRYSFFLLVDDICLESIEMMNEPVFKLVKGNWAPDSKRDEAAEDEKFDWEGGGINSVHEDVGWMYVDASDYVDVQDQLQEDGFWPELYVRPPLMRWWKVSTGRLVSDDGTHLLHR